MYLHWKGPQVTYKPFREAPILRFLLFKQTRTGENCRFPVPQSWSFCKFIFLDKGDIVHAIDFIGKVQTLVTRFYLIIQIERTEWLSNIISIIDNFCGTAG